MRSPPSITSEARSALMKQAQDPRRTQLSSQRSSKTWGARPGDAAVSAELKHLASMTYNEEIADAAIAALRAQDDASSVSAILTRLQQNTASFESRSYADNLDALALLARNDKDRRPVRSFLIAQLNHPKPDVRYGVAKALGTLKDPAAIAVLEPLALVAKPYIDPFREAVAKSLESLQANLDAPAEAKTIWQRLDELQRKDTELRKQLDDLKKQKDAKKRRRMPACLLTPSSFSFNTRSSSRSAAISPPILARQRLSSSRTAPLGSKVAVTAGAASVGASGIPANVCR